MSHPLLPAELLDHIIDHLQDERDALKNCCLVSKSWIPRSRKHLFARVRFSAVENLRSWKTTFPDPSSSPACYTRYLSIGCTHIVATTNAEEGSWISTFSHIVRLEMEMETWDAGPQSFNFIMSFPLLEDVSLTTFDGFPEGGDDTDWKLIALQPSPSPAFTGSLQLAMWQGMIHFAPWLLSLPNGLHFWKLDLTWHSTEDVSLTTALVEECHSTLETLRINDGILYPPLSARVNLVKATKLKDAVFMCWADPRWMLTTLQTVTPNHKLQQVSLGMTSGGSLDGPDPAGVRQTIGEAAYQEWLELDRLLVQLSESNSIHLKLMYDDRSGMDERRERDRMNILLPEVMARGIAGFVGRYVR